MSLRVIERRIRATEFREVPGSNGRQRWASAVTYNQVDDYGTIWLPGVFDAGLRERMPTILYGHDWWLLDHVLGQGIDFRQTPADVGPPGVDVLMEFADPEEVKAARLAMTLTAPPNPVLKDVSVGFDRREWVRHEDLTPEQLAAGATEAMVEAVMDELSIVVRGAVPGAQMRDRRSWLIDGTVVTEVGERSDPPPAEPPAVAPPAGGVKPGGISEDQVVSLAKKVAAGELTHDEAKAALALIADGAPIEGSGAVLAGADEDGGDETAETAPPTGEAEEPEAPAVTVDHGALDADVDAALALLVDRGARR